MVIRKSFGTESCRIMWRNFVPLREYVFLGKRYNSLYVQGQSPEPRIREYFYYIDHQGMLFLDDTRTKNFTSCFKDKRFLTFFFMHLKKNETGRYTSQFPYVSLCGLERNFVRCDDLPVVFTKIVEKKDPISNKDETWIGYSHAEESLRVPFEPQKLMMHCSSGRVYHPAPKKLGGIGLVRSIIAIELSTYFSFEKGEDNRPTHFTWKGKRYPIDCTWQQTTQIAHDKW